MNEILIWLKKNGLYIERPFPWAAIIAYSVPILCMIGIIVIIVSWIFR